MIASTLGVLAVVVSVARSWPQVIRIVTHKTTTGVSVLTWSLAFSCSATWVLWGVKANVLASAISNAAVGLGALAILIAVQRETGDAFGSLFKVFGSTVVANVIAVALFGTQGAGDVAVAMSIVMFLPQAWTALRSDVSGVSPFAWTLIMFSSLLWGIYGYVIDELTLAPGTFVIVPAAIVVLIRTLRSPRSPVISLSESEFEEPQVVRNF